MQYLMEADWEWHRFAHGLRDGTVAAAVEAVQAELGGDITVGVESSYVQDPGEFDPYSVLRRADVEERRGSVRCANAVLDELVPQLWRWIDVWIGVSLRVGPGGPSGAAVTPARLWTEGLRHFRPWLGMGSGI